MMLVNKISSLCAANGISVTKLEKEVGLGNGTIGRWGRSSPTVENIKKVANYFGVTVDSLISDAPKK